MRSKVELAVTALFAGFGTAAATPAFADETPFAYVYTTDILPKGGMEIEQWLTANNGRPFESWHTIGGRTEFEYGVTNKLQLALYANYDYTRVRPFDTRAADARETDLKFTSVSGEAIYRLMSPYTHPVGLALYVEPAIGPGFREIEAKLLIDSHFLDDRLIVAMNPIVEYEWEREGTGWSKHTELQLLLGAAYRLAPGLFGGVEFKAKRELDGVSAFGNADPAADSFSAGPTLHYAKGEWWATLGVQAQLPWARTLNGEALETVNGFAHEEPRYSVRLRFGVEL